MIGKSRWFWCWDWAWTGSFMVFWWLLKYNYCHTLNAFSVYLNISIWFDEVYFVWRLFFSWPELQSVIQKQASWPRPTTECQKGSHYTFTAAYGFYFFLCLCSDYFIYCFIIIFWTLFWDFLFILFLFELLAKYIFFDYAFSEILI